MTAKLAGGGVRGELLAGFLRIANERMADAIRRISVREGHDPRSAALVAFGGAGGQHACALADLLGMRRILVPTDASLLSARGLGAAVFERFAEAQILQPLGDPSLDLPTRLRALEESAKEQVLAQGADAAATTRRLAFLRLAGQDAAIQLELGSETVEPAALARAFAEAYRGIYGYAAPDRAIEVESLRVVAASPASAPAPSPLSSSLPGATSRAMGRRAVWFEDAWHEADVYERERLAAGDVFAGPCLVLEAHCATVVEVGWRGALDGAGALVLERESPPGIGGEPG